MMTFNNNEKDFQEKLQKDTEIPVIVHERINQAYRLIENNTAGQEEIGATVADTNAAVATAKGDSAYTKTADGLTITCSEVFANSQAVYVTMQFKSDTPFPQTETRAESGTPIIDLDMTGGVDFNTEASRWSGRRPVPG